jgi:transposase
MSTNQAVTHRYEFALYPTKTEADLFHAHRRMIADLKNALLEMCEQRYAAIGQRETRYYFNKRGILCQTFTGKFLSFHCTNCASLSEGAGKLKCCDRHKIPSAFDMSYWVTDMLQQIPEWRTMPAMSAHLGKDRIAKAFENFFRGCRTGQKIGYPRRTSYRDAKSIPLGTGTRDDKRKSGCKVWKSGWRFLQRHDNPLSWSLYYAGADLKDRSTWIHARGRFPAAVNEFNNADIVWRDGKWSLSLCITQDGMRWPGREALTIHLDTIDCFATVNGFPDFPPGIAEARGIDKIADRLKSERDSRWPNPPERDCVDRGDWLAACIEISRLQGRARRVRRNALHVWTTRIIARASRLTIIMPASIKEETVSPRGTEKNWGAEVATVSEINRDLLNMAPATARAMLEYKAAEAGIPVEFIDDPNPNTGIGRAIGGAGKKRRGAAQKHKKEN